MDRHDLAEMRRLFEKTFRRAKYACEELKEAREKLKKEAEAEAEIESGRVPRDPKRLGARWKRFTIKIRRWEDVEREFRERLPAGLSPHVRRDLFEERGFSDRMRIAIPGENDTEDAARVKQVLDLFNAMSGGKPCVAPRELGHAAEILALDVMWPEFDAIESEAVSAYRGYLREARTQPERHQLSPRKTDAIVEAIVETLTPLEAYPRQRLEEEWPEDNPLHDSVLFYNDQLSLGEEAPPPFGTDLDGMLAALKRRWPMMTKPNSIQDPLCIALERGLIRAVVSRPAMASDEGYTASGTDEISNPEQLNRWLRQSKLQRPFGITFRLASQAASQPTSSSSPVTEETPSAGGRQPRRNAAAAEPELAEYLRRNPYATISEIHRVTSWSEGTISKSKAWKRNKARRDEAKKQGSLPNAVKFDERYMNASGVKMASQKCGAKEEEDRRDAEIDEQDRVLNKKIGEYLQANPKASDAQVARACGCTARRVEERSAALRQLAAEQAEDHREDIKEQDPNTKTGKRQKWVAKEV